MFNFFKRGQEDSSELLQSTLLDEKKFYQAFLNDLYQCKHEVIIECPFITSSRMEMFYPVFETLIANDVKIFIITRAPQEHAAPYDEQSERTIQWFEQIGIHTLLCTGNHHRKLAILDRHILYEGSLNILSQTKSREIMRRIVSKDTAMDMFQFLQLDQFINN